MRSPARSRRQSGGKVARELISLGWRCDTAFELRMHGRENVAHFFDWLATPFSGLLRILEADFDVFHPENLILRTDLDPHCVEDVPTGVLFHHQFPLYRGHVQPDFLVHYPDFSSKFRHLAARFRQYMADRPVTLVRQEITRDQALRLEDVVAAAFPAADVRFLYLNPDPQEFITPRGRGRALRNDGTLGDPAQWARVLGEEGLIGQPYRHATAEILGADHGSHNLATDNRFTDAQLHAAITHNPHKTAFRLERAQLHMLHGAWSQAEEEARAALAMAPDDPAARYVATLAAWRAGHMAVADAARTMRSLMEGGHAPSGWAAQAAQVMLAADDAPSALRYVRRAVAAAPDQSGLYHQQAEIQYRLRDFGGIVSTLRMAARLAPLPGHYEHMLANGLEAIGALEEALAASERAVASGETFHYHYTRAGLLLALDRPAEALAACQRAIPLAGDLLPALEQRITQIGALLAPPAESIRLVIWDLDETFWRGTLTEGGAQPVAAHVDLLRTLSQRGIINAVCSKNDEAAARDLLRACGAWDHIVFPRIAFAPKGLLIRDIIESAQLRASTVLFIDDNPMNLNEAVHYNPGLQVADAEYVAQLANDPRMQGKPDPDMTRLAHYRVLEQRQAERRLAGDNLDFLRHSNVRVSLHYDVMAQFPRILDLVNRTNQLNFTKRRWPETAEQARDFAAAELRECFNSHAGYVKVADRYGQYGICGFFLIREGVAHHFLFSCRAMNMGIEQFVWHRLGCPCVDINGAVSGSPEGPDPDWITLTEDADADGAPVTSLASRPVICVRGACDLSMMTHYLRVKYETIEEFPYPYQEWSIHPLARSVALQRELDTPAGRDLLARIPVRVGSAINDRSADVYVLSFSSEVFGTLYRSRSTDLLLPFNSSVIPDQDFGRIGYEDIARRLGHAPDFSAEDWRFMQTEFTCHGPLDLQQLENDVTAMFETLRGRTVIVLMLNTRVGGQSWVLDAFAKINAVVRPLVARYGYLSIDLADFVRTVADLDSPDDVGVHFSRAVYRRLAEQVEALCCSPARQLPVPA